MGVRARVRDLKGELVYGQDGKVLRYPRVIPKPASAWRANQRQKANEIYFANLASERAERAAKKEAALRIAGGY
jgi:hypothetical protein